MEQETEKNYLQRYLCRDESRFDFLRSKSLVIEGRVREIINKRENHRDSCWSSKLSISIARNLNLTCKVFGSNGLRVITYPSTLKNSLKVVGPSIHQTSSHFYCGVVLNLNYSFDDDDT